MNNTDPTIFSLEGNKSLNNDETDPNKDEKSASEIGDQENSGMKKKRGRKKGKRVIPHEVDPTRYSLRSSSDGGGRVLRSPLNGKGETLNPDQNPNNESVAGTSSQQEPASSGRKQRGRKPKSSSDKLSTIRNRVRHLVTRMNYEQNLIDAYSMDGWKGQSLEKLRPEKEIERAKAEIIKCKLRIRDTFKELGVVAAEGKLDNSLFDAKGEIDCEDIFCAKCGMKNVTLNNDIILCDGICDRGFHQNCLNPPLLTKDIPPGDEGWLCRACDCKLDCIVLLNESKGSNLCLQDTWEKVFPEAAAAANGTIQLDPSDLPSDDSEDDDYNPDAPEDDKREDNGGDNGEENGGGEDYGEESDEEESSGSGDSDFYTDSSGDENLTKKAKNQKKQVDIEALPSEDSDDDDFDPEGPNSEEESNEKMANSEEESDFTSDSDEFCDEIVKKKSGGNEEDASTQTVDQDMEEGDAPVVIGRRQREPTDYKTLYRETFGKASSDSSDDDDWSEKRRKKGKAPDLSESSSPPKQQSRSSEDKRHFGHDKTKTLKEYFETNQYPTRESKAILAEQVELTYEQVNKWFEAARRQARGNNSAEASNGPRRRGRPTTKNSADKTAASIIPGFNANSSMNNAQNSPLASVEMTTPNSFVNAQKIPPPSPKEVMDSERKKAIMRELRKQKMGR